MFRFLLITACLAVPVFSNSAGAPQKVCTNGLVPEHHVDPQSGAAPYSFSGVDQVRGGGKVTLSLKGDEFLGFAIQAHDPKGQPIGQFKVIESNKSQAMKCSGPDDTLTHKKIQRDHPINSLEFEWVAPEGYKGKAKIIGTVAKDGGTFWVGKVLKEINVE